MGEIRKSTETTGDLELAKTKEPLPAMLSWLSIFGVLTALSVTLIFKSILLGVLVFQVIFVGCFIFSLISIYRKRPKKLAIGTKALITKDIWAACDPQTLRLMNQAEMLKSMNRSVSKANDTLLTQKIAVRDLVKLPEKTAISILGYYDVPTCKFQVLEGDHSSGVYYGQSHFIKEETMPSNP